MREQQRSIAHGEFAVWRDHVDDIWPDTHGHGHFANWHRRRSLQQLSQHGLVCGIEVLHDNVRKSAARRHGAEELLKRFEAPGGGSERHDAR